MITVQFNAFFLSKKPFGGAWEKGLTSKNHAPQIQPSCVLARAWLTSKSMSVKHFDTHWKHKGGKSGLQGSEPLPDSCVLSRAWLTSKVKKATSEALPKGICALGSIFLPATKECNLSNFLFSINRPFVRFLTKGWFPTNQHDL